MLLKKRKYTNIKINLNLNIEKCVRKYKYSMKPFILFIFFKVLNLLRIITRHKNVDILSDFSTQVNCGQN